MNFESEKFVTKIKGFAPEINWTNSGDDKKALSSKKHIEKDSDKLEEMVRKTIVKEFGQEITKSKSYPLLVDAVVHNLKKKQLEKSENMEV